MTLSNNFGFGSVNSGSGGGSAKVYAQIGVGDVIAQGEEQRSLIGPVGVGSLLLPANTIQTGDSYMAEMSGILQAGAGGDKIYVEFGTQFNPGTYSFVEYNEGGINIVLWNLKVVWTFEISAKDPTNSSCYVQMTLLYTNPSGGGFGISINDNFVIYIDAEQDNNLNIYGQVAPALGNTFVQSRDCVISRLY